MKKFIIILLCILMCATLLSCDKESSDNGGQALSGGEISSTTNDGSDSSPSHSNSSSTTRKNASDAYKAVLINEMPLRNLGGKEVYFQDIFTLNTYESYEIPQQSALDMDGDEIEEFIIQTSEKTILLHYENGLVYGFEFDRDNMRYIYTDGAFTWYNHDYTFGTELGVSRISFKNGKYKLQEIARNEDYSKFYLDGVEVSGEKYEDHINNYKQLEFKDLNLSLIKEGKALELASKHWNIKQGEFEEETGYRYRMTVYKDGKYYRVCLYRFVNNSYYDHLKCLWVDTDTGMTSLPDELHAKG